MLESIRPLVKMGFSVIWLHARSKRPIESNWTGHKTKSFDELKSSYHIGMNCGVRPGVHSKLKDGNYLCIIDCDMKSESAEHQAEMEKALDVAFPSWELSPYVISGRNDKSMHIYAKIKDPVNRFQIAESEHWVRTKMPSKVASEKDRVEFTEKELRDGWRLGRAWEVTFMGTGSQAVLPPSIHPDSGREYRWGAMVSGADSLWLYEPGERKKPTVATAQKAFKFVDWDLMTLVDAGVSSKMVSLITEGLGLGEYGGDRSNALYAAINALCGTDLSLDQVVSILSDPENAISEKALEKWAGNRHRAAQWIMSQVEKVSKETSAAAQFGDDEMIEVEELSDDEAAAQVASMVNWRDRLDKNKEGAIKNTSKNRLAILNNALPAGFLKYNEFADRILFKTEPPWNDSTTKRTETELTNSDLTNFRVWFQTKFKIDPSEDELFKILNIYARKHGYHPVKDYLKGLQWDGKARISRWLHDYMGAVGPDKYVEAIARKTLVAAVARVMQPGCQYHQVLVLEGGQGVGKSSAIQILAHPWGISAHIDPHDKDVIGVMQNSWVIEIPEMTSAYRTTAESLKAFLSKGEDRARLAYERKAETFKRQCIFIGSTNQDQYLQDETGNRRFWPVKVSTLDREGLRRDQDQLWAEAKLYWECGEALYLEDKEIEKIAIAQQAKRYQADEWSNEVALFVAANKDKAEFKSLEVFNFIRGIEGDMSAGNFSKADQMRIAKCLTMLGYKPSVVWSGGASQKVWMKR